MINVRFSNAVRTVERTTETKIIRLAAADAPERSDLNRTTETKIISWHPSPPPSGRI
jgi:hypothetical protein